MIRYALMHGQRGTCLGSLSLISCGFEAGKFVGGSTLPRLDAAYDRKAHRVAAAALGGRALFTRSQTGLLPTDAAHKLRSHAEDMAAAVAAFVRTGSANVEEMGGVVRLAAADVLGVEVLPGILSDFRAEFPAIAIELSLSNQIADLLRRDADIAVRMVRPQQKALLAKRVGKVALKSSNRSGYPQRSR